MNVYLCLLSKLFTQLPLDDNGCFVRLKYSCLRVNNNMEIRDAIVTT